MEAKSVLFLYEMFIYNLNTSQTGFNGHSFRMNSETSITFNFKINILITF